MERSTNHSWRRGLGINDGWNIDPPYIWERSTGWFLTEWSMHQVVLECGVFRSTLWMELWRTFGLCLCFYMQSSWSRVLFENNGEGIYTGILVLEDSPPWHCLICNKMSLLETIQLPSPPCPHQWPYTPNLLDVHVEHQFVYYCHNDCGSCQCCSQMHISIPTSLLKLPHFYLSYSHHCPWVWLLPTTFRNYRLARSFLTLPQTNNIPLLTSQIFTTSRWKNSTKLIADIHISVLEIHN